MRPDPELLAPVDPIHELVEANQAPVGVDERVTGEAWIAGRYPAGIGRRVPPVDGRVELDARICALPCSLGHLPEEAAGRDRLDHRTVGDRRELPVGIGRHGLHELIRHTDGVVGVLVHDRVAVSAVEADLESGVGQDPELAFLTSLAPDELLDVRMVDVQDDHLGGAAGLAPALDGSGRGIRAPHEADGPAGLAATLQGLLGGPDGTQVDAGARPALEDRSLLHVPVQDR